MVQILLYIICLTIIGVQFSLIHTLRFSPRATLFFIILKKVASYFLFMEWQWRLYNDWCGVELWLWCLRQLPWIIVIAGVIVAAVVVVKKPEHKAVLCIIYISNPENKKIYKNPGIENGGLLNDISTPN